MTSHEFVKLLNEVKPTTFEHALVLAMLAFEPRELIIRRHPSFHADDGPVWLFNFRDEVLFDNRDDTLWRHRYDS
jgi:hypothetical protein